jgi:hypothetical protein
LPRRTIWRGRRIDRHDLADHHPVEQMAQGGEAQFCGRRGARLLQLLDVAGDVDALNRCEPRHAARRQPVEEFDRRARVGAARVRIAKIGGEEFKEAIGGARAGVGDEGGGAVGEGDELVHCADFDLSSGKVGGVAPSFSVSVGDFDNVSTRNPANPKSLTFQLFQMRVRNFLARL